MFSSIFNLLSIFIDHPVRILNFLMIFRKPPVLLIDHFLYYLFYFVNFLFYDGFPCTVLGIFALLLSPFTSWLSMVAKNMAARAGGVITRGHLIDRISGPGSSPLPVSTPFVGQLWSCSHIGRLLL